MLRSNEKDFIFGIQPSIQILTDNDIFCVAFRRTNYEPPDMMVAV